MYGLVFMNNPVQGRYKEQDQNVAIFVYYPLTQYPIFFCIVNEFLSQSISRYKGTTDS